MRKFTKNSAIGKTMAAEGITFEGLKRTLSAGNYRPVNILHGEEGYFIDELVKQFERIIHPDDRDLALTNVYAPQIENPRAVVDLCRQLPMMTDRQVVILREAQNVKADFLDKLAVYVKEPTLSTIFVIVSRGEKIKGKEMLKACQKDTALIFESPKVWESQLPKYIADYARNCGLSIEPKAIGMLADFVGSNLSRLYNEIDKLAQILGNGAMITPEAIERNIGISKDYNNFELVDAIAVRDYTKMMRIVSHFAANARQNPFPVTSAAVFSFFADILQAFYAPDRSDRGLQEALALRNSFALKRIKDGMRNYNAYQVIEILDAIRRYDAMSKGSGSRQDPYLLMSDLMFHIISAPGRLPL